MPDKPTIEKLLDLTQKQSNDSARKLGKLNYQHQEAEKKLNLLLQYRQDYQIHLHNAAKNGIGQIEWQNFITFINKLDVAISEQRTAVKYAESNRDTEKKEYQSFQRKFNSYNTLSQRYQSAEKLKHKKTEQKELDEFSTNQYTRQSTKTK
ncbi:MAG: flagellar export protein FliJ [Burkholderiales bacterium]|nr:flagellar export protein FliJ [Nitrosomonas sp.]MCP5275476.1 flagellar export protein FliJ [Burkholderiales bacterium]